MSRVPLIFKIVPEVLWTDVERTGVFAGAPVDVADGFIHFSTEAQVADTAARHFAGQDGLLLVAVDPSRLGEAVRWEPSRGGALFPHLYGPLPFDAVVWVRPFPGSREPAAGNREPGTGNREPATGNREPAAGNREPGTGNREPAAGNREPGTGNRQPKPEA